MRRADAAASLVGMKHPVPSAAERPADAANRLQILSCNILAGGSVRRYRDYVTHSWKHVLPTGKRANLDVLA